ncbi:MAG: hypothetical protein ABIA76_02250 [Candidatus Diapherotrites archaeon]
MKRAGFNCHASWHAGTAFSSACALKAHHPPADGTAGASALMRA